MHGDFLVGLCLEEVVGNEDATCVFIARPGTHPEDLPYLKATVTDDCITIVSPRHNASYLKEAKEWMDIIKQNKDTQHATKLGISMQSLVTKLQNKPLSKTTVINMTSPDIRLSNKYFSPNEDEPGKLQMLPVPYTARREVDGTVREMMEVMVIWRAYVQDTAKTIIDKNAKKESEYDIMMKMMKGTKL
jgi:hypothetical protein